MLCPSLIPFICHISEVNPRSGCKTTPFLMSIVGAIYLPLRRNLLSKILRGGVRRWGGWTNSSVMMLMGPKHHKDDTFQFSSRSDIRNPVKNPPSSILELDPWRTDRLEMIMLMGQKYHSDARFEFSSRLDIRNPVKNPPSSILELDPWRTDRLEMIILMGQKYHSNARFQISSRSDIRNPVKNPPVHHPGVGSLVVVDENGRWGGGQDTFGNCLGRF